MTDREKAIVEAYTGIVMLTGDKVSEFYKYLAELYGRPVYTHEFLTLDIKEKAKADFVSLCRDSVEVRENVHGEWVETESVYYICSLCGDDSYYESNFCPNCGADMRKGDAE